MNYITFENPKESTHRVPLNCMPPIELRNTYFTSNYNDSGIDKKQDVVWDLGHVAKVMEAKREKLIYCENWIYSAEGLNKRLVDAKNRREADFLSKREKERIFLLVTSDYDVDCVVTDHIGTITIKDMFFDNEVNQIVYMGIDANGNKRGVYSNHIKK